MKIASKVINNLKLLGVEYIARSDSPEMWVKVFSELHYQPNEYSAEMIDYQNAYSQSAGYNITDCSLILLSRGKAFGLWVLTLGRLEGATFKKVVSNKSVSKPCCLSIADKSEIPDGIPMFKYFSG